MAKLICESSSSSPPSRLSWWHDNVPFLGVNETIESGDYGGKTTKIEISLNVSEKSNDDVYTCQANNEVLQKSIHESIRLQVFCKYSQKTCVLPTDMLEVKLLLSMALFRLQQFASNLLKCNVANVPCASNC